MNFRSRSADNDIKRHISKVQCPGKPCWNGYQLYIYWPLIFSTHVRWQHFWYRFEGGRQGQQIVPKLLPTDQSYRLTKLVSNLARIFLGTAFWGHVVLCRPEKIRNTPFSVNKTSSQCCPLSPYCSQGPGSKSIWKPLNLATKWCWNQPKGINLNNFITQVNLLHIIITNETLRSVK